MELIQKTFALPLLHKQDPDAMYPSTLVYKGIEVTQHPAINERHMHGNAGTIPFISIQMEHDP